MGVVYPERDVAAGRVPAENGLDHINAARFFFNSLTDPAMPTSDNVRLLMLGSVVTGNATRRSDLDYFLVRTPLEDNARMQQDLHILSAIRATGKKYNVRLEGQQFTEHEVSMNGHAIGEPLWVSHVVHIQDHYPHWAYRKPVEGLRPYSIDVNGDMSSPEKRGALAETISRYFGHKVTTFREAGDFEPERSKDLHIMQRALEAGKAYARKGIALMALKGASISNDVDVTSKISMGEQTDRLLENIDESRRMRRATNTLNDMDREYDSVLEDALNRSSTQEYTKWLRQNYLYACAAALQLAQDYFEYINTLTWQDASLAFDSINQFEDDFSLHDSASEIIESPGQESGNAILINLAPADLDEFVKQAEALSTVA
jgi:hypothetical protein